MSWKSITSMGPKQLAQKTKDMMFNKQGLLIKFFIEGITTENVANSTYLRFSFTSFCRKHVGIQNLIMKGEKVWFSIN